MKTPFLQIICCGALFAVLAGAVALDASAPPKPPLLTAQLTITTNTDGTRTICMGTNCHTLPPATNQPGSGKLALAYRANPSPFHVQLVQGTYDLTNWQDVATGPEDNQWRTNTAAIQGPWRFFRTLEIPLNSNAPLAAIITNQ